jgi:DNA-binding XRE family transcriptional regulator
MSSRIIKGEIGKRIKDWRLDRGMSQAKAADVLAISLATIQRLESGADCSDLTRARIEKRIKNPKERTKVAA